ncbi:Putative DNA-binding protein ESCAROLA [Apostasia shenzhenica]|uniref:AT-hook motif nuclear-localized protein n=1 Tax=Apostasia shenzhenica TaxID=1088818 RepID=A0A2I0AEE2_9ASPA|nr:Putative DNA-binding protein ESCAROLA [Apostasia shenzhenica]
MDGREGMGMSVPASYFMHRGMAAPGTGSQTVLHSPLGMSRSVPNLNPSFAVQSPAIGGSGGLLGSGGSVGSAFHAASSPSISPHGVNITAVGGVGGVGRVRQAEQVRRKRGRPRKYGPDGAVSLALSPMSSPPSVSGTASAGPPGSGTSTGKRGRGRPPGTGRKQQLASLGEWVSGSAGMGFTPHIITIPAGEDIASKIMSFSQQGPRAICILSANGSISTVTLRQPATSGGSVTYEGRFEILCLSGSYLLTDEGSRSRSGGLSISLSGPDGRVIGGGVGGVLKALSPVQVMVGSFTYGGSKSKGKNKANQEGAEADQLAEDKRGTPSSSLPGQSHASSSLLGGWAIAARQQPDIRNAHIDIDLMRG